jgi:polar amino acid transport system substrate-binding protein
MQSCIEPFATAARRGAWRWRAGLFLVIIAVSAVSANTTAQTRQLRLASTPWPPFTNVAGQARFAIDLVQAALERIGVSADTTIVPEGSLTAALLEGRFDGSSALWRDDEREKRLLYSRPYLENRLMLVGRRGSDVSMTALVGLPLKRIALVEGYAYGEVVKRATGPTYVSAKTVEDSLQL